MKTCIVTGASGGIGQAIATALAANGYRVLLQGRNQVKLEAIRDTLNGHAEILVGDLNTKRERDNVLAQATNFDSIDLLVYAAGVSHFSAFDDMSDEELSLLFKTNLTTPALFIKGFINMKKKQGGAEPVSIINVGSAFGYIGYPGFCAYSASKFGLRGLTESLRREFSDTRFHFGHFAPRATQTNINTTSVTQMNQTLGNKMDSPDFVARKLIAFHLRRRRETTVGWPEKLFVRLNMTVPKLIDKAIKSKLPTIKKFMNA